MELCRPWPETRPSGLSEPPPHLPEEQKGDGNWSLSTVPTPGGGGIAAGHRPAVSAQENASESSAPTTGAWGPFLGVSEARWKSGGAGTGQPSLASQGWGRLAGLMAPGRGVRGQLPPYPPLAPCSQAGPGASAPSWGRVELLAPPAASRARATCWRLQELQSAGAKSRVIRGVLRGCKRQPLTKGLARLCELQREGAASG